MKPLTKTDRRERIRTQRGITKMFVRNAGLLGLMNKSDLKERRKNTLKGLLECFVK